MHVQSVQHCVFSLLNMQIWDVVVTVAVVVAPSKAVVKVPVKAPSKIDHTDAKAGKTGFRLRNDTPGLDALAATNWKSITDLYVMKVLTLMHGAHVNLLPARFSNCFIFSLSLAYLCHKYSLHNRNNFANTTV